MAINAGNNPFAHLWGSYQAAVSDPVLRAQPGGIQQFVWASIRNDFLSKGEVIPAGAFAANNALLSLAGQQRAANLKLQDAITKYRATGIDSALIAANHTAADIDSRPAHQQPNGPEWRIRFQYGTIVEGEQFTERGTYNPGLGKPQSISQLLGQIDDAAAAISENYGFEYAGGAEILGITAV